MILHTNMPFLDFLFPTTTVKRKVVRQRVRHKVFWRIWQTHEKQEHLQKRSLSCFLWKNNSNDSFETDAGIHRLPYRLPFQWLARCWCHFRKTLDVSSEDEVSHRTSWRSYCRDCCLNASQGACIERREGLVWDQHGDLTWHASNETPLCGRRLEDRIYLYGYDMRLNICDRGS